jgi:glycosyltransferase involved in cell wall biosynthesis
MFDILFFCDYFKPGYKAGGPISSIANMLNAIEHKLSIAVITRNHDFDSKKYPTKDKNFTRNYAIFYCNNLSHIFFNFFKPALFKTKKIYLNSFFSIKYSFLPLLFFSFFLRKKIFISVRGELANSAFKESYKKRIYMIIWKIILPYKKYTFFATSDHEINDIKFFFPTVTIVKIPNIGSPPKYNKTNKNLATNSKKIRICFISRIHPVKNLMYCLRILKSINRNYILDVYGPIEDKNYFNNCMKILPFNYKNEIEPRFIQDILRQYDLFFLPTKGENFGHIIYESIMSYVPCLISDQTPWNIVDKLKIGASYNLKDEEKFVDFINNYPMNLDLSTNNFQIAQTTIRSNDAIDKYIKTFRSI